ncbi:MAG: hypothetical protein J7K40_12775 [candidate division Zixibacteria bacterium]|nr:hypothetical protein [candidate division Zixibacteria bacterium]
MKVVVPYWRQRVSPVLDTAENFLITDIRDSQIAKQSSINLSGRSLVEKIDYLKDQNTTIILCGALSEYCNNMISTKGIKVFPWLCGNINNIIEAFINDGLNEPNLMMPGCRGRFQRRRRHRRGL